MTDFGVGCDCKITRIFLKNKLNTTLHLLFYKKLFLSLFEDLTEIAYIHNTVKSQIEKLRIVQVHFSSLYSDSLFYSK